MKTIRAILGVEFVLFALAALVHLGFAGARFQHGEAFIAESVIGAVLLAGWIGNGLLPRKTRLIAIGVQSFALLGTLVGLLTIAIGVGPRTALDLTLHAVMLLLLVSGLVVASRMARN